VLEPQADHPHRAFELLQRPGLVHARVDQDDPVAGSDRPCVAVRDARPGQRQAQAPQPAEHALAAPQLALAAVLRHQWSLRRVRAPAIRSRWAGCEVAGGTTTSTLTGAPA